MIDDQPRQDPGTMAEATGGILAVGREAPGGTVQGRGAGESTNAPEAEAGKCGPVVERRMSDALDIGEIVPAVMQSILTRMDEATRRQRQHEAAERRRRILAAARDFQNQANRKYLTKGRTRRL